MKKIGAFAFVILVAVMLIPRPAVAQTGKTVALETIGALTGMLIYNTYLTIGAVADGYGAEAYTSETVAELMDEQINGVTTLDEQFNELLGSGFLTDPEDQKYVRQTQDALRLLKKEAEALKAYANSGSEDDGAAYDDYRNQAWDKIQELLGLE